MPWPAGERPRRAGVSAFGISGTNAHVILEEAPPLAALEEAPALGAGPGAGVLAWVVSGRTAQGLAAQAGGLGAWLAARPGLDAGDVGWSLAATRSVFEHRAVVTGADREELAAGLAAVAAGPGAVPAPGVVTGEAGAGGKVVFVFPGQGAQWAGMGPELAAANPVFAARLAECGRALAPHVDWVLDDVLAGADGAPGLDRADVGQPALWAVMVALAAVWEAAGVTPDAVVGHSQGEIAAATVAGILSLEDAARVVAVRGRALSGLGRQGGMVSVVMPAAAVRELLTRWEGELSVAAVNGPAATVVSGDPRALAEFEAELSARHVLRWPVPGADFVAHSPQVAGLEEVLADGLAGIRPREGIARLFSTVTGRWADGRELDAGYWYANVRQEVRFADAAAALAGPGTGRSSRSPRTRCWPPRSPRPSKRPACPARCWSPARWTATTPARPGCWPPWPGRTWQACIDWAAVLPAGQPVDLPTYAFQRQRYWPQPSRAAVSAGGDGAGTAAEARFWAAVEGGDLAGLAGTLAVDEQRPSARCCPRWRPGGAASATTGDGRLAVPGHLGAGGRPGRRPARGTWLVLAPARKRKPGKAPGTRAPQTWGSGSPGHWPPGAPGRSWYGQARREQAGRRRPSGCAWPWRPRRPKTPRRAARRPAGRLSPPSPGWCRCWRWTRRRCPGSRRCPAGWRARWRWCRRWATPGSRRRCGC